MSLVRKFDNENKVIVNKSITSHSELADREAYGAHPISAIRKLPEKLHALKVKDEELDSKIAAHDAEVDAEVERINQVATDTDNKLNNTISKAQGIGLTEDTINKGKLLFTDYEGVVTSVQGGFLPDEDSMSLNDSNELIIKKVYTDENFSGLGTKDSPIKLVNTPDETTLDVNESNKLQVIGLLKEDGTVLNATNIIESDTKHTNDITAINEHLSDIDELNVVQGNKIYTLETITKGMGGYLNSYDFGKTVTQEKLTNYALQDIDETDRTKIFNGTKVINLHDNHIWVLTNTPDSEPAVFSWEDLGAVQNVSDATNDGIHGLVTGSYNEWEGSIDLLGHISINGLEENFDKLIDNIDATYVKKTDGATSQEMGLITVNSTYGVTTEPTDSYKLKTVRASDEEIVAKTNIHKVIVPANLDKAVQIGVTTNTIKLTEDEQAKSWDWLGVKRCIDMNIANTFSITTNEDIEGLFV